MPVRCLAGILFLLVSAADSQVLPAREYETGEHPSSFATGDLNGDGLADLVSDGQPIAVLIRAADGGFLAPAFTAGTSFGFNVHLGHLDPGGTLDLVYVEAQVYPEPARVAVRLGDGTGGFGAEFSLPVPNSPSSIVLADFDTDGDDDVAVSTTSGNGVSVFHSDGAGGLVPAATLIVGDAAYGLGAGDLDSDGFIDLVTANLSADSLSCFFGGPGGFVTGTKLTNIESPAQALIGDADEDGANDIFVAGPDVALYLGHGDGTFAPYQILTHFGYSLNLVDVDGNGYDDLVMFSSAEGLRALPGSLGPGFGPGAPSVPAGATPSSVSVMEVDGDGLLDAVIGTHDGHDVLVLPGLGFGAFQEYEITSSDDRPEAFVATDLDGDFDIDVAIANIGYITAGTTKVLLNDGAGGLVPQGTSFVGADELDIAAGDVDADGDKDLVWVEKQAGFGVQLGDGSGAFGAATRFTLGPYPLRLDMGDVDQDGDSDVAVKYEITGPGGPVAVFLANGTGGFGPPATTKVGQSEAGVVLADVTVDGSLDLVGVSDADGVKVFAGLGTGAFGAAVTSDLPSFVREHAIGDVNVDGLPDLVALHRPNPSSAGPFTVSVRPGDGSGAFLPGLDLAADLYCRGLGIGDLDADGYPEILSTSSDGTGTTLLYWNDGAGGFLPRAVHVAGLAAIDLVPVEFDGDGLVDVVVFSLETYDSSEITLLSNLGPPEPWTYLGEGKAGAAGIPMLVGHGTLLAGDPLSLELRGAQPQSAATLIVGLAPLFAPLKGGVLVPMPNFVFAGLGTDADGGILLQANWPSGIPSGLQTWYQFWVADLVGYAASNGVTAVAP